MDCTTGINVADQPPGSLHDHDQMAESIHAKRKRRHFFCPHCDQKVPKTTFYRHKRLYCNSRTKQWTKRKADIIINSSDKDGSGQDIDAPPTHSDPEGDMPSTVYS